MKPNTITLVGALFLLLFAARLLMPVTPWVGWVELTVMCAVGLWLFNDAAGIFPLRQRWLALGVNVTLGLLLLGMHTLPGRALMVFIVSQIVIFLLRRSMRTPLPTARPPLG